MEYNKIIFLDIDGVLNLYRSEFDKYGQLFHENFVNNLKHIIDETGAKIVLSSTWRLSGLKTILNMWKDRNLPGELIDVTPYLHLKIRGEEIQYWLDNNQVERYVIIDDDTDFLEEQKAFFVQTSDNIDHTDYLDIGYGLTKECAEKAIYILNENDK